MNAPNAALESFLKSIPLFSLVEPADMMDLLRLLRPVQLEAGQVLFREGQGGAAMWVLGKDAEVSISATPKDGKRPVVIAYCKRGDTVGEMALIEDSKRSATAVVTQAGLAHEISAVEFQTLRQAWSPAAFKILRRMCIELCAKLRASSERVAPSSPAKIETPGLPVGPHASLDDIEAFPALKTLPSVVKLALTQKVRVVTTDDIQPIFAEGEKADAAYFLVSGEVNIGRGGKTLTTMGPGSMFGIVAAIDGGARSASAITNGPVRMLRLADADFDSLFATGNRFAFHLVDLVARQLVDHIRNVNQLMRVPGTGSRPAVVSPTVAPAAAPAPSPKTSDIDALALELELELSPEMPDDLLA
ncbi:MAG: cyclic nucleotide-binding domain-containing protein [Myxococcaceae bacterium]